MIWRFNLWLRRLAWPSFGCEGCHGLGDAYPCECAYYGAGGPGVGPSEGQVWLRWLHGFIFTTTSPFWIAEPYGLDYRSR